VLPVSMTDIQNSYQYFTRQYTTIRRVSKVLDQQIHISQVPQM